MTFINDYPVVKINIEELAYMISHKCKFCKFKEARCSEKDGCENGVLEFLSDLKDN